MPNVLQSVLLSPNQLELLRLVCRYYAVIRSQLNEHWWPKDDGRMLRKWLQKLVSLGFIRRTNVTLLHARGGGKTPIYSPTDSGKDYLLALEGDCWKFVCTRVPPWQYAAHWIDLSECHIRLARAIEAISELSIRWINEWEETQPGADDPAERFTLYTRFDKIIWKADAAFSLTSRGACKVYAVEIDRNTSGINKIVASKTPGVKELIRHQHHKKIFPEATRDDLTVLHLSPTQRRIELLRDAFRTKAADSCRFWKFVCFDDWTVDNLPFVEIIYDTDGNKHPLVRSPVTARTGPDAHTGPRPDSGPDLVHPPDIRADRPFSTQAST